MFSFRKLNEKLTTAQKSAPQDATFRKMLWARFQKNRLAIWSLRFLYFLVFIALFANIIANDKPLYCKNEKGTQFPVFREMGINLGLLKSDGKFLITKWKNQKFDSAIWPLIPYSPNDTDFKNGKYKGPFDEQDVPSFRWRHHFGTDQVGRDVASGMIHGTRTALFVGLIAMLVASIIGIFIGTLAGWFGDKEFKISRIRLIMNVLAIFPAFFYGFSTRSFIISESENPGVETLISVAIFIGIFVLFNLFANFFERIFTSKKQVTIPLDLLIMRFIEVMNSIPALLLLLASVAVLTKQSILTTMIIIGLIRWTGIARFLRAELMRIRKLEYIEAARALGLSNRQIIWRHALPNALTPVLITIAFGIAGAILLESTLSFLGIGTGANDMTWGRILRSSRDYFSAWWLAIFPGTAIFLTVTVFNLIGEGLTDALDN